MNLATNTIVRRPKRLPAMLAPAAYDELKTPSLRLARSSRWVRRFAFLLTGLMILTVLVVLVCPWQQSITGSGDVVAYAPSERAQTIEAPIKGRIVRWGEGIVDNAQVRKGQVIAEIQDLDPALASRIREQMFAGERQVAASRDQLSAAERNLSAIELTIASFESQLRAYRNAREQTIASADAMIESARQKVTAEQRALEQEKAALVQVEADFHRQETLYREEIASQVKFQDAERKYKEAVAKVAKAEAYVESARNDLTSKERDREAKAEKAQVDVDYAAAALQKAQADVAKAESEVSKAQSELTKAEKDLLEAQIKVARQETQVVTAPLDGAILQLTPNLGSGLVKEGDPLCTIVPQTENRAVQMWVAGNDAPLIQPGRHVRLQFEGWPAVQFAGWPSVAVGTFGGEVISVDATDDGKGRFRILVAPAPNADWPDGRYLRQGVRANGWVLLEQVPLWFEVWRRLNAFPPVVTGDEKGGKSSTKPPKLPKP